MNLPVVCWKKLLKRLGYRANWRNWIGKRNCKVAKTANVDAPMRFDLETLETRFNLSVAIDFDTDSSGTPIVAGEIVSGQWSDQGLTISTSDPTNHPVMIFDTANITGGDADLGTPHQDFVGPGIGYGGRSGAQGENSVSLHNVLIISVDGDSSDPDDYFGGGTIVFDFDSSVSVERIDLLDIDYGDSVIIRTFDTNQNVASQTQVYGFGNNSVQSVPLNAAATTRLEIELEGSGAISAIEFDSSGQATDSEHSIFVVDTSTDQAFQYGFAGEFDSSFSLDAANRSRGAATSPDGSKLFVINANRRVYVFDTETDQLLGSWRAAGVGVVQGIATDGEDVWIVDRYRDKVHHFENAATYLSGSHAPSSSFLLDYYNFNPSGITTDGELIWVVDRAWDSVFVYDLSGNWLGEWFLDNPNRRPTGIAVDPNGEGGLWVLDSQDDEVYYYDQGRDNRFGLYTATSSFGLDYYNWAGEGIAIASSESIAVPNPPVINSIQNDSGVDGSDGVTNDNTLLINGVSDPGNDVTVSAEFFGVLGTVAADANGDWSLDASSTTLPDGSYILTATASNGSVTSEPSIPFSVTIDTQAPNSLSIRQVDADTGYDGGDGITNDNTLGISGVTEPDVIVALSEATLGQLGVVNSDSTGNWNFDLSSSVLADGNYLFTATATDIAGNVSSSSAPLTVIIDTASPDAPALVGISNDSGANAGDGVTNVASQTISGTAEPGSLLSLFDSSQGELASVFADANGDWSVELVLSEASYEITARATDLAGNESSDSVPLSVLIDQTVPQTPEIVRIELDSAVEDGITNDNTLLFNGISEAGSFVVLSEATLGTFGSTIADSTGNWSIDGTGVTLVDGFYIFTVLAEDLAGNLSSNSQSFDVEVDTIAPNSPSLVRVDDDSGVDSGDGVTNDNTLLLSGLAAPGSSVTVSEIGLGIIGTVVADVNGAWVLDASSTVLPDGSYQFAATAEDTAGNISSPSALLNVVVDTVNPSQASILSINVDSGFLSNDGVTQDSTLVFAGTAEPNAKIELHESTLGVLAAVIADGLGDWQVDFSGTPLADGSYSFSVETEDLAGNSGPVSEPFHVVVDTTSPGAPSFVRVDDDNGPSNTDNITNDNTLIVTGVAEPGSVVTISETLLGVAGMATTDAAGAWVLDLSATPLADGAYDFTATATDAAGNESPISALLNVVIDTVEPSTPTITSIDADTGALDNDGITSDDTLIFSGTGEAGSVVTLTESILGAIGSATVDASGNWLIDATANPLVDGIYSFTANSEDAAGNMSDTSVDFGVTVDSAGPSTPSIAGIDSDTGSSDTDAVTRDNTLALFGIAPSDSIVKVFEATLGLIGSVSSDASGAWNFDASGMPLADGVYEFTAVAEDTAGNDSPVSNPMIVVVDTAVPVQPAIVTIASDTGSLANDGVTNDNTLVFSGTAEAGSLVVLSEATIGIVSMVTTDTLGAWQLDASNITLADGDYSFTVVAEDLAGNISMPSAEFSVVVDTLAPAAPSIVSIDEDTGVSSTDLITSDNQLVFVGVAEPNAEVTITEASLGVIGITASDSNGAWSFDGSGVVLADGSYQFAATAADSAGNVSSASVMLNLVVDTTAPLQPSIDGVTNDTGSNGNDGVTNDNALMLFGTAEANSEIVVSDSVIGFIGSTVADLNGDWELDATNSMLADGSYELVATSQDLAGNNATSPIFELYVDTVAPATPSIVAIDSDLGISSADGITSDSTLVISGMATPETTITVSESTLGVLGSAVVDSSGSWSLDLTATPFADGNYELRSTAEDIAGNVSAASTAYPIEIDTIAPATPTLDLEPAFDTAPVGDQTTDETQVTLVGQTEPGSVVNLVELGLSTMADASGDFNFPLIELSGGPNLLTVVASDIAGNESTFVQTITSNAADTLGPVIFAGLLNDTGVSSTDRFSTDASIIGSVTDASPLAIAELALFSDVAEPPIGPPPGGPPIGPPIGPPPASPMFVVDLTTVLDGNGDFQLDQSLLESLNGGPLLPGPYSFAIFAEDMVGNANFFGGDFVLIENDNDDITPPEVTLSLLQDTGPIDDDFITSDATLSGTVVDTSPVTLQLEILDTVDFNFATADITDLLQIDGTFTVSETRLEQIYGAPLFTGFYEFTVLANDRYTSGEASLDIELQVPPEPPVITGIENDTGSDNADGITNDASLTILGSAEFGGQDIEVFEATLGSLGTTTADFSGNWSLELPQSLPDGQYVFTATSMVSFSSFPSDPSNELVVLIDSVSPLRANFDLDLASDTGELRDSYTTLGFVTLVGTTFPNAEVTLLNSGQSTIADALGNFIITNVQLELGRHIYEVEVADTAGNTSLSRKSIAYDQPISLTETGFVTEATQLVDLGVESGTRTILFNINSDFGAGSPEFEDVLNVYLVDPADFSTTLLDRGENGTALFSLIGDRADFLPGLVRFDGSIVEIDVSGIESSAEGMLIFQLINNDGDSVTQIDVSQIGSVVEVGGVPSLTSMPPALASPAEPIDVNLLSLSTDLNVIYENIRYDSLTNTYVADIRVRNNGPDIGRTIVVTFDSLASDIAMLNASGVDGNGNPYINMRSAIPTYGLLSGQTSDRIKAQFTAPTSSPFVTAPSISDGGVNLAPVLDPVGTLNVMPGDVERIELSANDPDGEGIYFTLSRTTDLPNTTLTADGQLVIAPSPDQIGTYTFDIVATDGLLTSSQPVTLNVVADPDTSTRISGYVMDIDSIPLPGIPVELGGSTVLTDATGYFELSFAGSLPSDTLLIRGEAFAGPEVYPFIAEKLPLLLGHDGYDGVNNFVERPIYLPALDVANGVTIDPAIDVTVTTSEIPNASVFVAAGSLEEQGGGAFTGDLSITEVPADFTPAALPPNLFPDLVVTIQPGEMIFTTPAPLNLPNLGGFLPGTEMTLWSINPNTGLFDDVGTGEVSADGSTVETVTGGINNSSWHFFSPGGPDIKEDNPRNQDKQCDECELTDSPSDDNKPDENNDKPGDDDSGLDLEALQKLIDSILSEMNQQPSPSNGGGGSSFLPGWSQNAGGGDDGNGGRKSFGFHSNTTPTNSPLLDGNDFNADDTEIALHSGALYKSHNLVPYQSLEVWRGLELKYDSERADARPIVNTGFNNVQSNFPDPIVVSKLAVSRGNVRMEVPGYSGSQSGLTGGEHFFDIPNDASSIDFALQADLRSLPTGIYQYESSNRFSRRTTARFVGTASTDSDKLVHVNTIASPFGAGWGLAGLTEIVENPDGSVLLVDGSGGELAFLAPQNAGEPYQSPEGDFSALVKLGNGQFMRVHPDQTVEQFGPSNRLSSITDRNGNQTQFQYNADDNIELIVDPVGLTTIFRYADGKVTEIEDPAGRITALDYQNGDLVSIQDPDNSQRRFAYDSAHRLVEEIDKRNHIESYQYSFSGRVESITRKDGSTVQYNPVQTQALNRPEQTNNPAEVISAADLGERPTAEKVDANGNVTRVELDQRGQLVEANDAEGDLPELGRGNDNLVERVVDGRGNLTIIDYDDRGNVISVSDPVSRGASLEPLFDNPLFGVGASTFEISAIDLNNDGFEDLVANNSVSSDSISVLINDRAGGYFAAVEYAVSNPTGIAINDVNNDGQWDVAVSSSNDSIAVLLGNGDGTLQSATTFAAGDRPDNIESADLNGDGFIDLVVANYTEDSITVHLGDGTGQFNTRATYAAGNTPRNIAIGDLNNDGVLDIVVGNRFSSDALAIYLGAGDGTFGNASFIATSQNLDYVKLDDITGDGIFDIITGGSDLLVLPGIGDGSFGPEQQTTVSPGNGSIGSTLFDIDGDGDLDLFFTETSNDLISILENDGTGNFTIDQSISAPGGPVSTIISDLNLDGIPDLVTLSANNDEVVPFIGADDGSFLGPAPTALNAIAVGDGPGSIEVGDFNNDGLQDLIVGAQLDNTITLFSGAGDGTLTQTTQIVATGLVLSVAAGDMNNDGNLDIVSAHYDSDVLEVRYGDGVGNFAAPVVIPVAVGPRQVKVGDFNNDTFLDIVATGHKGTNDATYSIVLNNGDGTFGAAANTVARFQNQTVDVGDIDNDGNLDFVIGQSFFSFGNAARPFIGNGDGTFVDQGRLSFAGGSFAGPPRELKLADLDDDGNLDIVGVDRNSQSLRVLKGNGNTSFEAVVSYPLEAEPRTLDIGDVDNDGLVDVIATSLNTDRVSIYFGQNDGTLGQRRDFAVGDGAFGVKLIDLNDDGSLDFVVSNSEVDSISIHINSTDLTNQSVRRYEYDPEFSQLSRSIDEEGRQIVYGIDPINGNTISVTQVIGAVGGGDDIVSTYTYTSQGLIDTITDPLGRVTDRDYNAQGLLIRETVAVGTLDEAVVEFEYDLAGNQTAMIDELGHRTEYEYDELNRVTQTTEPDPDGAGPLESPVTSTSYDSHGNLVSATDALNNTTQFIYDEQHRLIELIDADLYSIKHEYDEAGNLTATMDRLNRRTEFVYDQRNRLIETIDAEGGRFLNIYDEDNNVVRTIDENGLETQFVYDSRNRLIRTINALGGVVSYDYDRVDNLVSTTDELGRRTEVVYDELNRRTTMIEPDPDGSGPDSTPITQYIYDDADNLRFMTDALGNTTQMVYDSRNRMVQLIEADPDGAGPLTSPITTYVYDDNNRLIETTDALLRTTTFQYDDLDRVTQIVEPDPDQSGPDTTPVTTHQYDAIGNLRSTTDALGNVTEFQYDDLYRLTSIIEPDPDGAGLLAAPVTTFVLDAEGQQIEVIDPLARKTSYEYDELGRIVKETLPDPDGAGPDPNPVRIYEFDPAGYEISMTDELANTTSYEYDDLYRMVSITEADPDGAGPETSPVTTQRYDAAHQLLSRTDALNRTTEYQYDDLGRIVELILPDPDKSGPIAASVFTMTYDLIGNELSQIDALGNATTYEYDNLYRQIRMIGTDPDGVGPQSNPVTNYEFDAEDQLVSITDPENRRTEFEYDDLGRLVTTISPDPDQGGPLTSPVFQRSYDLMDNEVTMTDSLGNITEYAYDNLYRLIQITEADPDGAGPQTKPISTMEYDVASQMTAATDALGRRTNYEYDDLGRLFRVEYPDPDGAGPLDAPVMTYQFDLYGNEIGMTDALGNTTQYEYDNLYRRIKITEADPDGAGPKNNPVTEMVWDLEDQLSSLTDALGRTTSYQYDDLGRVTEETYPDPDGLGPLEAPRMRYEYDLMSNRLASTDALGFVTSYEYDGLYRQIKIIEEDPDGSGPLTNPTTTFEYDLVDQLLSYSDPLQRTTTYEYDDLGRVITTTQPDPDAAGPLLSPVTTYTFDAMNNELSMTDPNGNTTQYEYDNLYRLTKKIDADIDGPGPLSNPVTIYGYDVEDNLLSYTDALGNETTYEYDDLNRQVSETIELGPGNFQSRLYQYDIMDNLIRSTDRNERVIEYVYDNLYRKVAENWFDQTLTLVHTIQFDFDNADQLLVANDLSLGASTSYLYDDLGRITETTIQNGGPEVVLTSAYDVNSRLTQKSATIDGDQDFVNDYSYDMLNRLSRIVQDQQPGGNSVSDKRVDMSYNAADQIASVARYADLIASAEVASTDYGYDGIGRLVGLNHTSGGAAITSYDFVFDPGSRIAQVVSSVDGTSDYGYDHLNQISSENYDFQADQSHQYDENGNRTNAGFATGDHNRLVSDGTYSYEYDDEGNRTKRTNISTGEVTQYAWDHRNRLTTITNRESDGGTITSVTNHRYDAFNNWISRDFDADGDGAQSAQRTEFIHHEGQMVLEFDESGSLSHRYLWAPDRDMLLADERVGDDVVWALGDHQHTIRDVVDSTGVVVNHLSYDAFGNITSASNAAENLLFGFTGRAVDSTTGLQNNLNRWYESTTGRWVSEDPISYTAGDSNLYRYVGNNAVNNTDPDGLMSDEFWARSKRGFDRMGEFGMRFVNNIGQTTIDLIGKPTLNILNTAAEFVEIGLSEQYSRTGMPYSDLAKNNASEAFATSNYWNPSRELRQQIANEGTPVVRKKLQTALQYARLSADVSYRYSR